MVISGIYMHLSDYIYNYRLINLNNLQDHVSELSMHAATCKKASELALQGQSPIILNSEIDNYGLASVLCAICKGCHREIIMKTSLVLNISKQSRHFDVNVRAVCTQVNRMFRSRRVLAIGGKHCDYGWTGSVFIHFYVL